MLASIFTHIEKNLCEIQPLVMSPEKKTSLTSRQWNCSNHLSCEKKPGWLFDIGDEILPNYMGILIIPSKDP